MIRLKEDLAVSQFDSGKRRPHSARPQTLAVHAGDDPFLFLGAASPPIFETSTFLFESFEAYEEAMRRPNEHCIYTRGNNPTVRVVEEKLAALEGAEACRLFGSGMAAISSAILSCLRAGDHVVTLNTIYWPARDFMKSYLSRWGVSVTFVDGREVGEIEAALQPNTKVIYLESPSTAVFLLQDLAAVAKLARARGITTIIDNSWATALLQRPIDLGIDLVVYSATKFLGGHSDVVAGAVLGSQRLIDRINRAEHPLLGGIIGPFEAWLIGRGLRSLPARMRQHQESTAQVVDFLAQHPRVQRVHYPGHPSHPQYALAQRQMKGASSVFSIELDTTDLAAVRRFTNALQYFGIGVSWGGYESLVFPMALRTSHRGGEVPEVNLVRLHVGLEDPADLIADLDRALQAL
jgi:cystathionine beta-lyase